MMKGTYLLIESTVLPWRHSGKQFGVADWSELGILSSYVARFCFTANELRFAEHCDFHACRKRERKSDYQRRYRVFGDTGKSGQLLPM